MACSFKKSCLHNFDVQKIIYLQAVFRGVLTRMRINQLKRDYETLSNNLNPGFKVVWTSQTKICKPEIQPQYRGHLNTNSDMCKVDHKNSTHKEYDIATSKKDKSGVSNSTLLLNNNVKETTLQNAESLENVYDEVLLPSSVSEQIDDSEKIILLNINSVCYNDEKELVVNSEENIEEDIETSTDQFTNVSVPFMPREEFAKDPDSELTGNELLLKELNAKQQKSNSNLSCEIETENCNDIKKSTEETNFKVKSQEIGEIDNFHILSSLSQGIKSDLCDDPAELPCDPAQLRELRQSVIMELLWVQQAIISRKNFLKLKSQE